MKGFILNQLVILDTNRDNIYNLTKSGGKPISQEGVRESFRPPPDSRVLFIVDSSWFREVKDLLLRQILTGCTGRYELSTINYQL
jgi:hypothetical protein